MDPLGFTRHDHDQCRSHGLHSAEEVCAREGLSLTPQRRRVLEILLRQHRAMGAYDLMDVMREEGRAAQPPTVYRALERHKPAFLLCRACGAVAEMPARAITDAVRAAAESLDFALERVVVEAEGLCPRCREAKPCG